MRILILALLIFAGLAYFVFTNQPDGGEDSSSNTPVADSAEPDSPATSDEAVPEPLELPYFDVIRVERNGYAVVSGYAEPNSEVVILANGDVIHRTPAGPDGGFADAIDTPLSAGPVQLGLRMITPDGREITSENTIIIYVPESDADAPVVLRTTPGGATEIIQGADADVSDLSPLTIDSIDYDQAGNVIFSGRAEPNRQVQIFADRQPVGQTASDDDGRWTLSANIRPGRYTLQIIQLDENGRPAYAIEVPFEQATLDNIVLKDGNVIVQPGNSLWVISRKVYGEGQQYTVIYEANAEQIRDPDLIYPGQIFTLPEDEEANDGEEN